MVRFTLKEVAEACGGRLVGADPDAVVRAVVTDSRLIHEGAVFVALRGERVDGHDFVPQAVAGGAVAALVREDRDGGPVILVEDPLTALRRLAEAARDRLAATVIAVTGSSGKTGTKDMIAAACASTRGTLASEASFNNEIGVPLTILAADERTEVLVVEVGSRGLGHIAALMPAVRPHVAVVTNVGVAHAGMFGDVETTARAKGELVAALDADGIAVLNADDGRVRAMSERTEARALLVGRDASADLRIEDVELDEHARARFTLTEPPERVEVALRVPGEHTVSNAALAIGAARGAGVALRSAAAGVGACEPAAMRMQIVDVGGMRILNDAYNANPDSMAAALKTLVAMGRGRPTWAVLGYMAELGDAASAEHDRIGRLVVRLGVTHLVTVGREARAIHEAARLEGMFGGEAVFVPTIEDAVSTLQDRVEPDAVVLIKASRAVGLERVVEGLREDAS